MGAAASVGANVDDSALSDAAKAELFTHLKAKYDAEVASKNVDEAEVLKHLRTEYIAKAKALSSPLGVTTGGDEDHHDEEDDLAGHAAAFAAQLGMGGGVPATGGASAIQQIPADAPGKTSDFRKRRLSVTKARGGNSPKPGAPGESGRRLSTLYRAQEIGAASPVPLPFPETIIGTYSCHGVEPSYYEEEGVTAKINQDRGCVVFPFAEHQQQAVFAVFDGHGEHGDIVSHFVMHEFQSRLEKHPTLASDPVKALKETYVEVDHHLGLAQAAESTFSGTTAVSVLMREGQLWIANAGDSRAVLARKSPGGAAGHVAKDLSIDQNPNSPAEQKRIEACGGFVSPPPEPGLSARVWLDREMTQIGLAMARSIGDHAVKNIGVIAEPEVTLHTIGPDDSFLILASDGVWEFVSSQEAVDKVAANLDQGCMKATQALIEMAAQKWREVEGDYRDDITAVVCKLPCF